MDITLWKVISAAVIFASVLISNTECGIPLNSILSGSKLTRDQDDLDSFENEDSNIQGIREQVLPNGVSDAACASIDTAFVFYPFTVDHDLRKLILKKLRFRDLEDETSPYVFKSLQIPVTKRNQNNLVDKVAALLSGLKVRQISDSPNVRMPSLRFG